MQRIRIQLTGPGQGPGGGRPPGILARILLAVLAACALVVAAFLGAFFFLAALGVFFAASIVMAIRIWWSRRRLDGAARGGTSPGPGGRDKDRRTGDPADVIEGEYKVLGERDARRDGDRPSRGGR